MNSIQVRPLLLPSLSLSIWDIKIPSVVQKVAEPVFLWLDVMKHGYYSFISYDKFKRNLTCEKEKQEKEEKVEKTFFDHFLNLENRVAENLVRTGAAICGTLTALHQMDKIDLGKAFFPLLSLSNGLFLTSYLITMDVHIKLYYSAQELIDNPATTDMERETLRHLQKSSLMMVLSSLSYVLMGGLLLFGSYTTLAFILGGVAIMTNAIKFLYDWVYSVPQGIV